MWTSASRLDGVPDAHKLELCSIINAAIRSDLPSLTPHAAVVSHGLNTLCVVRAVPTEELSFPEGGRCFCGGGFDESHRPFFTKGKKYRVPGFLATSFSEAKADEFLYNAHVWQNQSAIKWIIHLDPRGATDFAHRCKHVNLVKRTNVAGEFGLYSYGLYSYGPNSYGLYSYANLLKRMNVAGEWEFLFAAYSAFEVLSTGWNAGTDRDPHVVHIQAAIDNRPEDENLPLAPWY